ncbi:MAG: LysE family translocator [Spirochaetia bacterium]|nr:LysE family translocator [Spirochaetia bacterium]
MSITPGPNNIMVTASGANFGYKKTIPHLLGIWVGFSTLMILSALGLKQIFDLYPIMKTILKICGVSYMLFLAVKIMRSSGKIKEGKTAKPFTLLQAALFQIINPKAVMMAITSMSVYTIKGDLFLTSSIYVILIFNIVGFPATSVWTLFGTLIGRKLKNEKFLKIFNYSLGGLTACAALLLII